MVKMIIGRGEEKKLLEDAYKSKKSAFIAVYGRRRIGKTFLIRTFFILKKCNFFHVTGIQEGHMQDQIDEFCKAIEATFYHSQIQLKAPDSWTKAFELLTNTIKQQTTKNKKIVLFFDELPWLATQKSGFVQALDYYWNRFWSNMPNLKLVVCGSAASWMIKNILHHTGGLHNRVTTRIVLDPFNLVDTRAYLKARGFTYNEQQILEIYMIMGGIPFYLDFLKKNLSVSQNIDHLCFNKKGPLVDEFGILYASLFQHYESHGEIIRILALKKRGVERTELLSKCKLSSDGGTFNKRLKELEASGFIVSFTPYGFKKRGTYLRIVDEYTLFYLAWIAPALSTINKIDKANRYWIEQSQTPSFKSWSGYAFEAVCFKHIEHIRKALGINASALIGNWQHIPKKGSLEDGAQIDLLFDRSDGIITVCEIKYSNEPYRLTKQEAQALLKKITVFKKRVHTNKQVVTALITVRPIQETMYSEEIISGKVTLEDFIKLV